MTDIRIGPDREVTLHFARKLASGEVVDSTFDRKPATFRFGDGNLLPGFELALQGLKAGDKRSLRIEPEHGFGQPNPQNVQVMPRSQFEGMRSEEHTSELQSRENLVCRLLLEKKKPIHARIV